MSEEDAVKVCLRVRPLIHREQGEQVNLLWKAENNTISQVDGTRSFSFDRVFHSHETTCQVYQEVAVPITRSALQGYNGTIFAYGQTSSGKTYTMMGTPDNLGIIPRAVKDIFKIIMEIPNREFLLRVSYMEIYNETVTDLLCDDRKKKPLEIREDINRNVYVADLTEELVMEPEHVLQWIKKGEKNRHYGETKMNDHSSRSHTIFRMIVESRERSDPGNSENCDGAVMVSHLNLVDLAGSERASQTGAEGVRFKEGCNINRSLFILGQVIKKLSDGQVGGFINYRDSKLTRILQNSLGGNTKTVIICTITPVSLDETLSTLQFASTAKHVRNTPHVNEVLDDQALLKRYRKEINDLKKQLEELEDSSEIRTHAMAEEERSQLLAEIKQLQKEKEDRMWNLTNIVVASSQHSHEDQRVNRKRRVTWAPGKLQNSLCVSGVSPFEIGSKLTANLAKRPKVTNTSPIQETDDSICTEFSDFDDASRVLDDFGQDADWNFGSRVTCRDKTTALSHSMIDFSSDGTSVLPKDSSLQKRKELEQKVAELQNQLTKLSKEYEEESRKRESLERETVELQQQLQSKNESDELVRALELEITSLKDQIQTVQEYSKHNPVPGDCLNIGEELTPQKTDEEQELPKLNESPLCAQLDGACQDPAQEQLSSHIHGICQEQIQMLEQKIADLEGNASPENNEQTYLMESVQICEALLAEKQSACEEFASMQSNFEHLAAENESLKREIADFEKCLQEKHETNEFERLEKETQKDHETQLIHEISSLKKLIENAEVYNQELENELENKSKLLKEQEKQMAELKKESEMLQKKGDSEKLCEEVFQMRQSLTDAETVTRDAQREAAFLRSENLEMKEKLDELSIHCEKREKNASDYEKQLEVEKSSYKRMQADLQKELQYAFNEINQLNGLMVGKVPKDLLSHVELDKKVADYSKQLASLLEEKKALEQEVASLLEYKPLPSEVEHLEDQVHRISEELLLLKNEKEQSASIINDQKHNLLEQIEQIEKLTEEVTQVQAKCRQSEQQYSDLKMLRESLEERSALEAEDLNKKKSEADCLLKEMDKLKHSMECVEQKCSATLKEKDELLQAKQKLATHVNELEELLKSSCIQIDNLQGQVNNQTEKQSEFYKEKQELEEKYTALLSEKEQLQEQLHVSSSNVVQPENAEASSKLEELQDALNLAVQLRDELLAKVEDLETEKNSLRLDLNENIELSIETQDELRTTQEELNQQKQLVADLRKQLADCAGDSSQAESQGNVLEEKVHRTTEELLLLTNEKEQSASIINNQKHSLLEQIEQIEKLTEEVTQVQAKCRQAEQQYSDLKMLHESLEERSALAAEDLNKKKSEADCLLKEMDKLKHSMECLEQKLSATLEEKDELLQAKQELEIHVKELEELLKSSCMQNDNLQGQVNNHQTEKQSEFYKEKQELEEKYTALLSEKEQLQEQLHISSSNVVQPENAEASSKLEELQDALNLAVQLRDELLVKVEDLEAEKNGLRLDLNENIELSIETQDELRTTQEELNQQKQLVADLRKQLADSAGDSSQAESQGNVLEELSTMTEKLQENEAKYEILTNEKMELERVHQSLISEMELLQERMHSAEMALSKVEEENNELKQKLKEQLKSGDLVELMNSSTNLQESKILEMDLNRQIQQEDDGKNLQLQEQMLAMLQDKDERLKNITAERDQLKQDLQEKIEMSVDTQEELRSALDELKVKTQLLESLNTQMNEIKMGENGDLNSLCEHLKQDCEKYLAQLHVEKSSRTELQCEVEEKSKKIEEHETKLEYILRNLEETESKYEKMAETLELVTKERDHLIASLTVANGNHLNENASYKQDNRTKDQGLQVSVEMPTDDQFDTAARQGEIETERDQLKEILSQLQQQLHFLSQEKGELQQIIDNLKKERCEMLTDLQRHTENSCRSQEELQRCQEELKQQISFVNNLRMEVSGSTSRDEKGTTTDLMPSLEEEVLVLQEALLQNNEYQQLIQNKEKLEQDKNILSAQVEGLLRDMTETQSTLQTLQNEKLEAEKKLFDLGQQMEVIVQERDHLKNTQQRYISETDQESQTENNDQASLFENDLEHRTTQCCHKDLVQSNLTLNNDLELLKMNVRNSEEELEILKSEKYDNEQKINHLQSQVELTTEELNHMKVAQQCLILEMAELKEELEKNVEKYTETQDELKRTQEELEQQKQRVQKLTNDISMLEEKSVSLMRELEEKIHMLNTALEERQTIDQSKADLTSEMEQVMEILKSKEFDLKQAEKEKETASHKILELANKMQSITQERDDLQHAKENLAEEHIKTQDELKRTREELEQQKQRVEKLTNDISFLEEKSSSLEKKLEEKLHILNKALEERQTIDQSKEDLTSEMEQVMEILKSKEFDLKQAEKEKEAASHKILELANKMQSITQERDDLQHAKENLVEEAKKLMDEMEQVKHEYNILANERVIKASQLDELDTELQQLQEKLHLNEASAKQLETDKVALQKQSQQYELEVASLRQEQEQFQHLLQRARSEKENIYASLQDQEKALQGKLSSLETELQAVKMERDENKAHLDEKVNEVNETLQKISSLEEQMQQLHQKVKDVTIKNLDLREKVDLQEKEIEVLRLMQSEPAQEDDLAERTEILERKTQEWKDLMANMSIVYAHHHSLLNNLSGDLQSETEAQKQSMSVLKESLSLTLSKAFGKLQTEHDKLNSQMQTLLNKFKVIYRNATVKEEHYSLVQDYMSDLCAVQKKNDELLLQRQSLEQRDKKWYESAAEELKFCELEFMNQLIFKKMDVMKNVEDGFSVVQVALKSMESDLKEEIKCKKEFMVGLEEFKGLHFDTKKLSDGVLQENKRIAGVIQHFTKKLKIIAQSKTKQDAMMYLNSLETDLQEKKEKNKELLQRMQQTAPSADSSILEEENARLRETLKNVQRELKKMQCRIRGLENELSSAKEDVKQKEQKALLLEDKLLSSAAECELSEMKVKMDEKEKHFQAALKEIQTLQERVAKGAVPYKNEIDSFKDQVVRMEMDRMKLSKVTDQQIASLKASIEDKETSLRKLKEQLRRTQKDVDTTICSENSSSSQYPLTCGGGSGIVQSTAMLILQSENAALKRDIAQYKKKCHQFSRNISSYEDELKKLKDQSSETPTTLLGSLHQDDMFHSSTDLYRGKPVTPSKSEMPTCHIASPGKTGRHRKHVLSPSKTEVHRPQPMSPNKMDRHSVPAMSPGNTGLCRKRPVSPFKTDGPLFSTLTASPCKKQNFLEKKVDSPKDKFFDARSKSLPYCPSKFFDNSALALDTLPGTDFYAGTSTETSDVNNWWDRAGKTETPNNCKTS